MEEMRQSLGNGAYEHGLDILFEVCNIAFGRPWLTDEQRVMLIRNEFAVHSDSEESS